MSELATLHVQIDAQVEKDLRETMEREDRKKNAIVERAIREYNTRSKAEAAQAKKSALSLIKSGQLTN